MENAAAVMLMLFDIRGKNLVMYVEHIEIA